MAGDYAVRPALHLNLTSAASNAASSPAGAQVAKNTAIPVPQNITNVIYDGGSHWLNSLNLPSGVQNPAWIDAMHTDSNIVEVSKIEYTDPQGVKTDVTADGTSKIIDAGTYSVTLKIKDSQFTKGNYAWRNSTSQEAKFDIKIAKKKLEVKITTGSDGVPVATTKDTTAVYIGDTVANGRAPVWGFKYTSTTNTFDNVVPNKMGTYTAEAKIVNDCNYEVDTSKTYTTTYTRGKTQITAPAISQTTKPYSGQPQQFSLMNGSLNDIIVATDTGMTYSNGVLEATKAGTYTVRIALKDKTETEWKDRTDKTADFTITVEITKKPLTITFASQYSGTNPWAWTASDTPTITITGDSFVGDQTVLYIYYMKNGGTQKFDDINNNKVLSADGKTRTIVMPKLDPGAYSIGVEIYGSSKSNDNYVITGTAAKQQFSVAGAQSTFTAPTWLCNNMAIAGITSSGSISSATFTYTGNQFQITVDEAAMNAQGYELDKSSHPNGFTGDTALTNAGSYTCTVYVKPLASFAGTAQSFILNITVDKALYDLSKLSWDYDSVNNPRQYTGKPQKVELIGAMPTGLTPNYMGNKTGTLVKSYITSVDFNNSNPNYVTPSATISGSYIDDTTNPFQWTCNWAIDKMKLNAEWTTDSTGKNQIAVPKLKPVGDINLHTMVDYTFWESDAGGNKQGNPLTEAELKYDKENELFYVVEAALKSQYQDNYILVFTTPTKLFSVGKDRLPVSLTVLIDNEGLKSQYPYKGSAYVPQITIVNNPASILLSDIVITYYKDGSSTGTTDNPVDVGQYRAEISVKVGIDNAYVDGNDTFNIEIVKADFDMTNVKWQYTHGEVTATYDNMLQKWIDADGNELTDIKFDGKEHKLELLGVDGIPGLTTTVTGDIAVTDAKQGYVANVSFAYDTDNYNAPQFDATFTWNVAKAVIDTSNIVWGYVTNNGTDETPYTVGLPYTRIGDAQSSSATEYTMRLINLPIELQGCITYNSDVTHSKVGMYTAEYSIDPTKFNANNYEECQMPSGLAQTRNWEIVPRVIDEPTYNNSFGTFDGKVHSFVDLFKLPEDWELYFEMDITKDYAPYDGLDATAFPDEEQREYKLYDTGVYLVKFTLKNGGTNIVWRAWPQDITVNVQTFTLNVTGWNGNGINATVIPDLSDLPNFFDYRFKDTNGNIITDMEDIYSQPNTVFFREIYVKEPFASAGNVALGLQNTTFRFVTDAESGTVLTPVARPTLENASVLYDGKPHALKDMINGFDPAVMEFVNEDGSVVSDLGNALTSGSYTVLIRFKNGQPCRWETTDGSIDRDRVVLTFVIEKNYLTVPHAPEDLMYTGQEIDISAILVGFDPEIMTIEGQVYGTNAGIYKIVIALKDDVNYGWTEPQAHAADDGASASPSQIEVEIEIAKVKLSPKWNTNGTPTFSIPSKYQDLVEIEHLYYDEDGNEISADSLQKGNSYRAVARLLPGYEANFEFVDSSGAVLTTPEVSAPYSFELKDNSSDNNQGNNGNNGSWGVGGALPSWIVYVIIAIGCFVLFDTILLIVLIAKKQNGTKDFNINIPNLPVQNQQQTPYIIPTYPPYPYYPINNGAENVKASSPQAESAPREAAPANFNNDNSQDSPSKDADGSADSEDHSQKTFLEAEVIPFVEGEVMPIYDADVIELANAEAAADMENGELWMFENHEGETVRQVPENARIIAGGNREPRPELSKLYTELSDEQKRFWNGLRDYAAEKSGAKVNEAKFCLTVGTRAKSVIKLGIKDATVVALFRIEDPRIKQLRRNSESADIKTKDTIIQVLDQAAYDTAKDIIDLRIVQIAEEKEYQKQLRKEKRLQQKAAVEEQ